MVKKKIVAGKKISFFHLVPFILLFLFFVFFLVTSIIIGLEVKENCKKATNIYQKGCNTSLILLLNDKNRSFKDRNSAIWALGQLGRKESLPELVKYYNGNISPRESLFDNISQYELKKAINLTSGGTNITAIWWRWMIK